MVLGTLALGVGGLAPPVSASASSNLGRGFGTPLPAGWELCVLQGINAPLTADGAADLDEWQKAEGGSTNNLAAYNPFNTRRATDATGAALPVASSARGFPAFASWAAGCAATVATLLQPNMAPILTALRAGGVALPGVFLTYVDQSAWCAPSGGIPCYASQILAGELVGALVTGNADQFRVVLASYADTSTALNSYQKAVSVTAQDQVVVTQEGDRLATAVQEVAVARGILGAARTSLRRLALDDYTSDQVAGSNADLQLFEPSGESAVITCCPTAFA